MTSPDIPRAVFMELLELATSGVQFSFNEIMYEQMDGVAMGSPLGPTLANIFVGFHEKKMFNSVDAPVIYCRYVDDTFAIFEDKQQGQMFLQRLSQMHPALKFTIEGEINNSLPFLDVLVERTSSNFNTSVYRKRTFTGGDYTSWESFTPLKSKLNVLSCLVTRAVKICSPSKLDKELHNVSQIFKSLGYPEDLIRRTIKGQVKQSIVPVVNDDKPNVVIRLPYIGSVSERFRKQLSHAVDKCYDNVRLQTIFTTKTLINAKIKDRTPTLDNSNIIYKFVCSCDSMYVGRTTQRLQVRVNQHVPKFLVSFCKQPPNSRKPITHKTKLSAIGQHLKDNPQCGASYDASQFSVLARARSQFHLNVLEAVYIQSLTPNLCKQKEFVYGLLLFKTPF